MQTILDRHSVVYQIAGWVVDVDSDQLLKNEKTIKLEPKIMKVLLCLMENRGRMVTKDDLLQTVWEDVTITDHPLNRSISRLRKIFQDDPRAPKVIETIPKKGYRLICPVEKIVDCTPNQPAVKLPFSAQANNGVHKKPAPSKTKYLIPALCFLLLILAGNFIPINAPIATKELYTNRTAIPLTTSLGLERSVSFSPDDQKITYLHKDPETKQWDVYLQKIDGTPIRLTNSPSLKRNACFSPDGNSVSFIDTDDNGSSVVSISLIDSSISKHVTEIDETIISFDWSPDAKTIAYSIRTSADNPTALFLLSLSTGKKVQLTSPKANYYGDRLPKFSPDGSKIVFARFDSQYNDDLYLISMKDYRLKRLSFDNQIIFGLDWSPLTSEIIYCVYDNGVYRLKSINTNGESHLLKLSFVTPYGTFPSVSHSGKQIAYEEWILRKNIYSASIDGPNGKIENLETAVTSSVAEWNAKLSPDGSKIVFLSDRSGSNELWMSGLDGSNLQKIIDMQVPYNCMPSWAPNGRDFVFAVKPGENYLTYRYTLEDESTKLIESDAVVPEYSRDGNWIYFSSVRSGDWRIWKIPASGGDAEQITQTNGFAAMESVDGKTLFYCKRGIPGIWKHLGEGKEEVVIDELQIFDTQNWLVVEEGIYYFRRAKNYHPVLVFYNFREKSATPLEHPLLKQYRLDDGLSLNPQGNTLFFSLGDHIESDIKMIEFLY